MAKKPTLQTTFEDYQNLDLKDKTELFQKIQKDLEQKYLIATSEIDLVNSVLNLKKG